MERRLKEYEEDYDDLMVELEKHKAKHRECSLANISDSIISLDVSIDNNEHAVAEDITKEQPKEDQKSVEESPQLPQLTTVKDELSQPVTASVENMKICPTISDENKENLSHSKNMIADEFNSNEKKRRNSHSIENEEFKRMRGISSPPDHSDNVISLGESIDNRKELSKE